MPKYGEWLVRESDEAKDPTLPDNLSRIHALLYNTSASTTFGNVPTTLDLLVARGWPIASMSTNLASIACNVEMYLPPPLRQGSLRRRNSGRIEPDSDLSAQRTNRRGNFLTSTALLWIGLTRGRWPR